MIKKFKGETRHDAIVNHFSLDIIEEEAFMKFVKEMSYTIYDEDDIIESLHNIWYERENQ